MLDFSVHKEMFRKRCDSGPSVLEEKMSHLAMEELELYFDHVAHQNRGQLSFTDASSNAKQNIFSTRHRQAEGVCTWNSRGGRGSVTTEHQEFMQENVFIIQSRVVYKTKLKLWLA